MCLEKQEHIWKRYIDKPFNIEEEKMLIEKNTNYAFKLKYIEEPCFDDVRNLSVKFMHELPRPLQNELYEKLNHGVDLLDSEPMMETYLYAYGKMHQAKLDYAFNHLPEEFLSIPEINIIDYGCGQALGTMCYVDFLRENGYEQKIKAVSLIEPSEICLKRAALNISIFLPECEIITVNKTFDELGENDVYSDKKTPTLHILSNVLDILDFNLEALAETIKKRVFGFNQFVCVGPFFNYTDKDDRMEDFCSCLYGEINYTDVFDKYELNDDKSWTCQLFIFSIGSVNSANTQLEQYKLMAKHGNAKAQNYIGVCYYNGDGVPQDYEKAVEWFAKAAKQNDAAAQYNLGYCYYKGKGLSRDYDKAFSWYSKAANQGYASAQFRLGRCYRNGTGVPKDQTKAFFWYSKAAEQGFAEAQTDLGDCYYFGEGTTKDVSKAAYWYSKAVEKGSATAQQCLADCYEKGEGVKKDIEKAIELRAKAKEQGVLSRWLRFDRDYR